MITRRDVLKLMGKVAAVVGVGVTAPSMLMAKEVEPEVIKEIETVGYMRELPPTGTREWPEQGTTYTVTNADATSHDKWIYVKSPINGVWE